MPMKNRYQYNRQTMTFGTHCRLTPLGYMEVLPGETLNGRVTLHTQSAPTIRNINNRVYSDCYAFFIPYRLLEESWTDFIADNDPSSNFLPVVLDLNQVNFEHRFTYSTLGTGNAPNANAAWKRRAYRICYEKFFALNDGWDQAVSGSLQDDAGYWTTINRPSTWEVADVPRDRPSQSIAGATTVDELRTAFSQDQWDKMRQYYGSRYTDYMMALGVNTPWTLLEEPELLAKKSQDLGYRQVSNMTAPPAAAQFQISDQLAANAGYFNSKTVLDIKRKFIPEHGLVAIYQTTRTDPFYQDTSPMEVFDSKIDRSLYWSPEFEARKEQNYSSNILAGGDYELDVPRIPFDEYRRGMNTNVQIVGGISSQETVMSLTASNPGVVDQGGQYDNNFIGSYFPDTNVGAQTFNNQYQHNAEWRISRRSPLIRQGQSKPIR